MRFRIAPYSTRLFAACLALAAALLGAHAWAAERVLFYHNDAAGSPVAMTDSTGAVVWRADYEPFGGVVEESGTASTTHRFTGKERDAETGLDYFGARYYDARIGRFLSVDPVLRIDAASASPQRWNLYVYTLNNPFRYVDPDGKDVVVLHGGGPVGYRDGAADLSLTVRSLFGGRAKEALVQQSYGGLLNARHWTDPTPGTRYAEAYAHEGQPRVLVGWSLGGDAALEAGGPAGGGKWDLRVVVGAELNDNTTSRIVRAAQTSEMVVLVAVRRDRFAGVRSYEGYVDLITRTFGSIDHFYEMFPNVQIEPSDAPRHAGAGNHPSTQAAIERGVRVLRERLGRE